ncbi:hypothetical protein PQR02_03220 [Paraburkholderia sediminicola]|uniref:Uncharacterized protein n=1 Tax=Paraburkholderia rhynchosiae TaxID=487049 RepID=A0ACC7N8M6_9BURK
MEAPAKTIRTAIGKGKRARGGEREGVAALHAAMRKMSESVTCESKTQARIAHDNGM